MPQNTVIMTLEDFELLLGEEPQTRDHIVVVRGITIDHLGEWTNLVKIQF